MKKNYLFLAMVLIFFGTTNGQNLQKSLDRIQGYLLSETTENATSGFALGYCSNELGGSIGTNNSGVLQAAIEIPAATSTTYAGANLTKIKFAVNAEGISLSNVSVFLTSTLSGTPFYTQNVSSVVTGWNEITLSAPYTLVSNTPFYIGYSLTTTGGYPIVVDDTSFDPKGDHIAIGTNWTTLAANDLDGVVSVLGILEGSNLPQYSLGLENIAHSTTVAVGTAFTIEGTLKNRGIQEITSYNLYYTIGTANEQSIAVSNVNIPNNEGANFSIPNISSQQEGQVPIVIRVADLNGSNINTSSDASKNSAIDIAVNPFEKNIVIEEGTGTWCGWCPRGAVAMTSMRTLHPDRFIGIAVHNGDPMAVAAYNNGLGFTGFPTAAINRARTVDPSPSSLNVDFQKEETISGYKIEFQKAEFNSQKTQINIIAKVTSAFDATVDMRVAFVVVENDVTGSASGYNQSNYYSVAYSYGQLGAMGGYENLPNPVPASQMVYPEVARCILPSFNGAVGSVPANLVKETPVTYNYTLALPASVNNANNIELIALLLENKAGGFKPYQITNSVKLDADAFTTGIDNIIKNADLKVSVKNKTIFIDEVFETAQLYDMTGRKIAEIDGTQNAIKVNVAGVYILKTTRGEQAYTTKVAVK
jgi:hypothetical protein